MKSERLGGGGGAMEHYSIISLNEPRKSTEHLGKDSESGTEFEQCMTTAYQLMNGLHLLQASMGTPIP